MGRRSRRDGDHDEGVDKDDGSDGSGRTSRPELSVVPPLSLLAAGIATYPSLSAAAAGDGDLLGAITLFLAASVVAMIGFGIVAVLIHNAAVAAEPDAGEPDGPTGPADGAADEPRGEPETGPLPVGLERELDAQAGEIDDALAATESLLHDQGGSGQQPPVSPPAPPPPR